MKLSTRNVKRRRCPDFSMLRGKKRKLNFVLSKETSGLWLKNKKKEREERRRGRKGREKEMQARRPKC